MSNHLGNVLTVINDIKVPYLEQDNLLFKATIVSTADYSPFGVQLDERTVSAETYRYGYQGSEKDDEVKGEGNSYTTEFRMLDPRLGRWLSIDPLADEFPWQSTYVSMDNNPIELNDSGGDKPRPRIRGTAQSQKNFYRNLRTANTIARVNASTRGNGQNRGAKTPPLPRPPKHFTPPTSRPEILILTWSGYDRNEGFSTSRGPYNPPQQRGVRQTPELLAEGVELLTALAKSGYESFTSASLTYDTKYQTKPFCKTEEINSDFQITFDSKEEAQVFNAAQAAWESVYLDNLDKAIANQESNLKNPMSAPGPSPHQIALLKTIMQVGESPLKRLEKNLFESVKTGAATHDKKYVVRETVGNGN